MVEEDPLDGLDELDGLRTLAWCVYCDGQFPFRECRLFVLEEEDGPEYVFVCETCHDREIMEPFRKRFREQISEADVLDLGERAHMKAVRMAADDPEARREALTAWVRFQMQSRKGRPPPSDPSAN
jgi:hypothetical protein